MSYYLRVLCRGEQQLTRDELAERIVDGAYFPSPAFEPAPGSPEAAAPDWKRLLLRYQPDKRPVIVHHDVGGELVEAEVGRLALAVLRASGPLALRDHLAATRQIFAFEVAPETLSEEAWELLDATEMWLARTLDGIIYADGEGFYDANLRLTFPLK